MNIEIKDLNKIYPNGNHALKEVSLEIGNGMFGLLGPNGAGKSSLMRILVTLMKPSKGQVLVNGLDLQKHRREIRNMLGYLPQDFRFFAKLTTWEFLDYSARLAGIKQRKARMSAVEQMLEEVGLYEARNRMANKLSGGMKRRLGIAQALIGEPKIIIVDEPTTGLDPEERIRFRNLLSSISEREVIIILSTHIVGDISSTCTDMALLNQGSLAYHGAPDKLIEMARGNVWQISATETEYQEIQEKYPIISSIPAESGWEVQVVARDVNGYAGEQIEPNLEHAYVNFMEHELNQRWHEE
ncbi:MULTISPECIES: ABC transporter ATP-binding protein [Prolixibacter]|uniref:ABC-type multidrug transport system ATPase subunit n=1 Tax=Prolixibacter denitrificans TaxID=1541063 RepID=A0A2P8CE22_9BACT|nr:MULTISPECIES: ABC transporter ATP-binding protein [Prolixibacter]PSK83206.1 ABC-type multidrug transport system ATPase subunit [Prolixibacter denitrificans]GET21911.1 multidrug ABC transporter ATP-binding protein [Prolixibacter denitrificans]GET24603.1 multidrug ABC transporter ATP-binding protein [Prolixibacter sp. NT017]